MLILIHKFVLPDTTERPNTNARPSLTKRIVSQLHYLQRDPGAILGFILVSIWLGLALLGPVLLDSDPNEQDLSNALTPPMWQSGGALTYPLGTDHLGRDILTRVVYGARTSLLVGLAAVTLAGLVGTAVGVIAAEWGGWVEEILMRLADIQLAIPFVLLGITVLALLGASMSNMILVLILFGWVIFARIVRSEALSIREQEFMLAARAIGVRRPRIVIRHLVPNVVGLVITVATLELANVIILESALSFLGVGIRPPQVSWGVMLADGRDYLTIAWWPATVPGIFITSTIFGVNLLGDWVRDMLNPRFRSEQ